MTAIDEFAAKIMEVINAEKNRIRELQALTEGPMDDAAIIKQIMKATGLTQTSFALEVGMDPSVLSEVLHGRRKLTRKHIGSICQKFGLKANTFRF